MAITSAQVQITVEGRQTGTIGIATPTYAPSISVSKSFTNGTDAVTKLDIIGSARLTMTGSAVDLDLAAGGLVDANNDPVAPVEAVCVAIKAADGNAGNITFTTGGTNGWDAGIDGGTLGPGGWHVFGVPTGYAITAGTADLISFTGTADDTVDVLVLGRSA